jgi:hypothetical protein
LPLILLIVVPEIPLTSDRHERYESAVTVQVLEESRVRFEALAVLSGLIAPVRDEPF